MEYAYPPEYGLSSCAAHDYGLQPFCVDTSEATQTNAWCFSYWCYVDPTDCNVPTTPSAYLENIALHFSYEACGNINHFNAWY